jgi:hypothetical protein
MTYFPAAQSVQAVTLDEVEYLPAAHMVHLIAPVLLPLSVTEPALQLLQFTPASHGQYIPAMQGMHSWPRLSWNFPGGQFVHLSALRALYFPATHTVQPHAPLLSIDAFRSDNQYSAACQCSVDAGPLRTLYNHSLLEH